MMMTIRSMEANKEDDKLLLPGFRFHPTDEELLSFYLRRKIENKLITIEFIKQIDIYKYDPWDLPKDNRTVTDKEWYFFCRRGRKYRNSVRPNRVTGSGFWKATGIDKPIYSVEGQGCGEFIGLKKTLVYYRGSAGRGTKTDWMMHEFRLPTDQKNTDLPHVKAADQEAEVWTLCRIFKRNLSHGRYTPDCRKVATAKRNPSNAKPKSCDVSSENWGGYIGFGAPVSLHHKEKKPVGSHIDAGNPVLIDQVSFINVQASQPESCSSSILSDDAMEFFAHGNWDELVPVMELPFDPSYVNNF